MAPMTARKVASSRTPIGPWAESILVFWKLEYVFALRYTVGLDAELTGGKIDATGELSTFRNFRRSARHRDDVAARLRSSCETMIIGREPPSPGSAK